MDFLTQLRERLSARIAERQAAKDELDAVLVTPTAENRDLNDAEAALFAEAKGKVTAADNDIDALRARIAELEAIEGRQLQAAAVTPQGSARVLTEPRTYTAEAERRDGISFLRDVAAAPFGDFEAQQRLARHTAEERNIRGVEARAVSTSAFAGLVVPQYLVDMVAPTRRAGRPLADIANRHPLPATGMTVEISKITTGASAALQSSQNSATSETNMDDTTLSVSVQTVAGQQTASVQALQRGSGIESIIIADLLAAINTTLDSTMITQATYGLDAITDSNNDVTYTDASPTVAELWPKLFDAVQQVQTNYYGGVSHLVMHPRRFAWIASQVGTSFPFVNFTGAGAQAGGSVSGWGYGDGNIAGILAGIPVILDANISTTAGSGTEDVIYAVAADEVHLWEDDVTVIRAEQTNAASLGVLFVAYKYFAYTANRYPKAHARVAGTGLITPTF